MLLYTGQPIDQKFTAYQNYEHDRMKHTCKIAKVSVVDAQGKINTSIGLDILKELELEVLD